MGQAQCCLSVSSKATGGRTDGSDGSLALGAAERIEKSKGNIQDSFLIGKVLGYGSFGEVRKAREKKTQKMFCVKIMAKRLMLPKQVARVYYEIELLKRFDHPNIIKIHEYYETQDKIYIVQELCSGGELYRMIRARKGVGFEEHEVATIIQQILMAVNYLHQHKVVHRDIKAENIVFCNKDELKLTIIDFGTAQRFIPGTQMTQPFGTPNYMAPEVIKGCYSSPCDLWSVGVLTYVLLVGQMPFKGRTDEELLKTIAQFQNMNFDVPALSKRSIGAIDFMRKLLHVDPQQRVNAEAIGNHQWLASLGKYTIDKNMIKRSLECFRKYKEVGALQKKVISYIVAEIFTSREADHYLKIFFTINKPADGMCTKDQFIKAFWQLGFTEMSEHELDKLLAYVDDDQNGYVTFEEFLRASVHPDDVLQKSKLQQAFKSFDADGSGSISIAEFQEVIDKEGQIAQSHWDAIFAEVDDDGSGEINLEEFSEMMQKIFEP